ncbi:hypothetical protein OIU19_10290 [Pseudomonas sp. BT-42-2]|jgi:hypothetical protein|uniref:DUF6543 domain-containing protein n=1 Tax=Pseudomonas sp. BT-42-2 TaxID=2986927 RepID=UPI0021F71F6C|nr:DUF6543 domain-containing protein [Pseudomonas sp. BT-42-2]MCV9919180.1 hypothetical protein [Pseudomonas sp. BT-42-2]
MDLHQRLAQYSALECQVAKRFSSRPTLLEVATGMLRQQWSAQRISNRYDPLFIYLVSRESADLTWIRPLPQVVVERFCLRRTLNLIEGEDSLSMREDGDPSGKVYVDLHKVETLINACAPFLLDIYKQALVSYWSQFDRSGQTPWGWYANHLQEQLKLAIDSSQPDNAQSSFANSLARLVQRYPDPAQRNLRPNARNLSVSNLQLDFAKAGFIDVDMASAVLIEHPGQSPERNVHLLYTLGGILYPFASRQALLSAISRQWPAQAADLPRHVSIEPSLGQVFEVQASTLFNQQLNLIDQLAPRYRTRQDALTLALDLDRLTAMLDLCSASEAEQRQSLISQLPDWLRDAQAQPLIRYSTLLLNVAQAYKDANGQFWLDDVATAEQFANQALAARFALDHPGQPLDPMQVRVINHQAVAAASPAQGAPFVAGEVRSVELSLAQLAIGNLGLLKPGRVELLSSTDQALPSWMNEAYVRTLITQLDIATRYPQMLTAKLLDDPSQRQHRQRLLANQLRSQLPTLALELHLRGEDIGVDAADHIAQVFSPVPVEEALRWVLRPLAFIKSPGAAPDHPLNTWLIEPLRPGHTPCLLYRPLHRQSLLAFSDRMALFVAISTPGPLQDDLLQRLPAVDRKVYAHGGFVEPHLFYPLDDTSAIPFGAPPPVELATDAPASDPAQALYQGCVEESIQRFREHSATSAQTRWNSWKELSWLLFNTLLPLAGETLGRVAWLAQMEVALAEYVDLEPQTAPGEQRLALVNLLLNVAMLLFSHSMFRMRLELDEPAQPVEVQPLQPDQPLAQEQPSTLPAMLDLRWAQAQPALSATQRSALAKLQSTLSYHELGSAIPHGPLWGLYLHQDSLWAVVEGKVYPVMLDPQQNQVRIAAQTPEQTYGPWLRRDESGRWQLDLSLRLRGGMPLDERLRQRQQRLAEQCKPLDVQLDEEMAASKLWEQKLKVVTNLANSTSEQSVLNSCLISARTVSSAWSEHVHHADARNAIMPLADYATVRAHGLHQDSLCLQLIELILRKLWKPKREQLLALARRQGTGAVLSPAELANATDRLNEMAPLLEQRISNIDALKARQLELGKMASRTRSDIAHAHRQACWVDAGPEKALILRFMKLESLVNRMILVHGVTDDAAAFWLERCWTNIQLGIGQRIKLFEHDDLSEEVQVRLLRSIHEQFNAAKRQLGNLMPLYEQTPAALETLTRLDQALDSVIGRVTQDLGELPNYPPVKTLAQLRRNLPGLIETSEHGLLLGEPSANDSNIVQIAGPDGQSPAQTYRLDQGAWREVAATAAAPSRNRQALAQLLGESTRLMDRARAEVQRLGAYSASSYLPIELEELVHHQRDKLRAQVSAIEQRLTEHNQVDEAGDGESAAQMIQALDTLARHFDEQAITLRTRAALAQRPRMAEVQYLIDNHQVTVSPIGTRTRLAKVKGRPDDYLDEYAINYQGRPLWFAHFHYAANNTARAQFTVGHLKTAAQRHSAGQQANDPVTGRPVAVYRAPITAAAAQRYFFST